MHTSSGAARASTDSPNAPSASGPDMPRAGARIWLEAARPRTLAAGATPVVVGTAAAGRLIPWRALAALVVALALQIAVNYANDLFDANRGIDTPGRVGPRRAVAAGLVTPRAMRAATAVALAVAGAAGLALAAAAGWLLIIVGLGCGVAALGYSGGRRPYASAGLGEVFVFVFFGLVATVGSAYVQTETVTLLAVCAAIPVGGLATAILVANNLRDLPTDAAAGKKTLAVRLGDHRTRLLFRSVVAGAFAAVVLVAAAARSPWPLIALGGLPLARLPLALAASATGPRLIAALTGTARVELVTGALLALGLWVR
jgi:1,4-dihydroxy-2-naphthoate polyprenyltransferase